MQTVLQSAFLQSLGYAIANSLWQVALLWIIVVIINSIGSLSSSKKYFVALIAQFAGFVWFICTLQFYYLRCSEELSQMQVTGTIKDNSAFIFEPTVNSFSSGVFYIIVKGEQLLPYLSIAYLCMLLFLGIRFGRAFYFTRQIRSKGLKKADVDLRLFIKRTAEYLGIKKSIRIYISDLVKGPLTLGFLKPLILIPVASINHLTTDQLEAILLHELAHIKRADYLINIIQSVIEILLFFNPFVQLIGKLVKKERENSCDDWVLQFQYKPAMYAEALLRIACIQTQPAFTMNAAGNRSDLLSRVKRMLNQQERSYHYRNQVFALLLITIMLSTVAWFHPAIKNNSLQTSAIPERNKIVVEPLSASVDNPLFNPMYFFTKPIQQELNKAITAAQDNIEIAAPIVNNATKILGRVSPIVLQKLQDVTVDLNDELKTKAEHTLQNIDLDKIKVGNIILADSTNFEASIKKILLKEINNTDWKKINSDINKAQLQLTDKKVKNWAKLASSQINDAVKNSVAQLEQLKTENLNELKQSAQNLRQTFRIKTQLPQREEAAKKVEKKIRETQKINTKKWIEQQLKVLSKPGNENTDKSEEKAAVSDSNAEDDNSNFSTNYTPAVFTDDLDGTYNISDSANDIQSAIIVVKHNPENDHSHTKHITVEITGNNGLKKTYEFTVEVYQ